MMDSTGTLFAAALAVPLVLLLACASKVLRARMPVLLSIAPLPALAAALFANIPSEWVLGNPNFALVFALDVPGAMLLGAAALLWSLCGAYAGRYLRGRTDAGSFVVCWLMTLIGCIGVFLAADLIGFYLLIAVLSVGATGLVLQGDGAAAQRAGGIYLGLALLAEAFLLVGLVLMAASTPDGSLLIRDGVAALATSPRRDLTLTLLLVGLGVKAALFPLHFWMPLAHDAAPVPASAVLSCAVVKTSVLALIRFLPLGSAVPDFGTALAAIGLFGALYGVAIGITQSRPKLVLAYSSVSQMGFVVAIIGMGLAAGDGGTALAAAFYAVHHLLVKGALFLAVGVIAATGRAHVRAMWLPAAVIALGLGGLPLTGGALTKYAVKDLFGDGIAATLAMVSSITTTLLMLHFLKQLLRNTAADDTARAPIGFVGPWLAMALASIVVPWTLYLAIPIDTLPKALAPAALWSGLWPVLIGAVLAVGLDRVWNRLPRIAAGDVGAVLEILERVGAASSVVFERADTFLRRWVSATIMLAIFIALFGWTLATQAFQ